MKSVPRWAVASSQTNDCIVPPYPSREANTFLSFFCFLFLLVSNDFCFCSRSSDKDFFTFSVFLAFQSACFRVFAFYSVCVCVWGGVSRSTPPTHTHIRKQRKGKTPHQNVRKMVRSEKFPIIRTLTKAKIIAHQ